VRLPAKSGCLFLLYHSNLSLVFLVVFRPCLFLPAFIRQDKDIKYFWKNKPNPRGNVYAKHLSGYGQNGDQSPKISHAKPNTLRHRLVPQRTPCQGFPPTTQYPFDYVNVEVSQEATDQMAT
jgi:hypothetical protein